MITVKQQREIINLGSVAVTYVAEKEHRYKDKVFARLCKNMAEYDVVHLVKNGLAASIEDSLIDSLKFAKAYNKKFLLYCQIGNLIIWEEIAEYIKEILLLNPTVKFIGHILQHNNKSFYIHPQFFLIDVEWAIANKCVNICNEHSDIMWEGPLLDRSEENFHDNYTPTWVKATGKYKNFVGRGKGANIIDILARSAVDFMPWQVDVRKRKKFLYPTVEQELIKQKNEIFEEMLSGKPYLANTEDISYNAMVGNINPEAKFDICFSPASGISWFLLPYYLKARTTFVYDVSPHALHMVEKIKNKWNGRNYKEFVTENFLKDSPTISLYAVTEGPHLDQANDLIDSLGEDFVKWWHKNNKGPFRQVNLCNFNNFQRLLVDNHKNLNAFFNFSNIFHFRPVAVFNSLQERIALLKELRNFMLKNYKFVHFFGTSPVERYTINGRIIDSKLVCKLKLFE